MSYNENVAYAQKYKCHQQKVLKAIKIDICTMQKMSSVNFIILCNILLDYYNWCTALGSSAVLHPIKLMV